MRVVGPDDEHLTARLRRGGAPGAPSIGFASTRSTPRTRRCRTCRRGTGAARRRLGRSSRGRVSRTSNAFPSGGHSGRVRGRRRRVRGSPRCRTRCHSPRRALSIVTELQPRERPAHLLGPGKPVDLVVHLREVFVEQAGVRLVLEDPHLPLGWVARPITTRIRVAVAVGGAGRSAR